LRLAAAWKIGSPDPGTAKVSRVACSVAAPDARRSGNSRHFSSIPGGRDART
jgi:hypothetical protein